MKPLEDITGHTSSIRAINKDRRRNQRMKVELDGRFLMPAGEDHSLKTVDLSCGGALIAASARPDIGDQVICYFDDLGRVSSTVVRHTDEGFAVSFVVTAHKREKLADRLTWLANYKKLGLDDDRVSERFAGGGPAIIHRADGRAVQCKVIDISLSGAAFEADGPAPRVGERVSVGRLKGEVVRTNNNAFAIRYLNLEEIKAQIKTS